MSTWCVGHPVYYIYNRDYIADVTLTSESGAQSSVAWYTWLLDLSVNHHDTTTTNIWSCAFNQVSMSESLSSALYVCSLLCLFSGESEQGSMIVGDNASGHVQSAVCSVVVKSFWQSKKSKTATKAGSKIFGKNLVFWVKMRPPQNWSRFNFSGSW